MRLTAGECAYIYLPFPKCLTLMKRIALAPPYPGLRRFKQGRNFNQWTGNDSKALMKVFTTNFYFYQATLMLTV